MKLNEERYAKGMIAKDFFMRFYNADCDRIAIENPIPSKVYGLPPYTQTIQPWMFGHPVQKKTCLWLKGLPKLQPTNIVEERQSTKIPGNWFNHGGKERQKNEAKHSPVLQKPWRSNGEALKMTELKPCPHCGAKMDEKEDKHEDYT